MSEIFLGFTALLTGIIFYLLRRRRADILKKEIETQKLAFVVYQATKLKGKEVFQNKVKENITLHSEAIKVVNLALLFSYVVTIFEDKLPGRGTGNAMKIFSDMAKKEGYGYTELLDLTGCLTNPGDDKKKIIYSNFQKELRVVTNLFISNVKEINLHISDIEAEQHFMMKSIDVFASDLNIVFNDFLFEEDFPRSFQEFSN